MTVDLLQRLVHDNAWTTLTASVLTCLAVALMVISYTAWSTRT